MRPLTRHVIVIVVSTIVIAVLGVLTRIAELPLRTTSMTSPDDDRSLMLRTDFSDESAWESLRAAAAAPVGEFRAFVRFVSDPSHAGMTMERAVELARQSNQTFVFIADRKALTDPERPILVVDAGDQPSRSFRVVPGLMWAVENNLSIANMDFEDFAAAAGPDGVFRGFRGR